MTDLCMCLILRFPTAFEGSTGGSQEASLCLHLHTVGNIPLHWTHTHDTNTLNSLLLCHNNIQDGLHLTLNKRSLWGAPSPWKHYLVNSLTRVSTHTSLNKVKLICCWSRITRLESDFSTACDHLKMSHKDRHFLLMILKCLVGSDS